MNKQITISLVLVALLLSSSAASAYADSYGTIEEPDDVSSLLQSEYAKSSNPISDTLLQPLPEASSKGISIKYPGEKYLLTIGQQRLPPIKLEATYNRRITLSDALNAAYYNNLPIKISSDYYRSRKALFAGSLGRFLPDLSMTYRAQNIYQGGEKLLTLQTGNTTLTWAYFQGGKVLYGALGSYYDMKAAKGAYSASINDALLDAYKKYNDVLYNQALLQVRIKSLETSRANLRLTKQQLKTGTGTRYAVMQSETQLASDAQNLVNQQVATRKAAIALAVVMNTPVLNNLLPEEELIGKTFLFDPNWGVNKFTSMAAKNRPELQQLENLRLASRAAIGVAASPLLPTAQIFVSPSNTKISGVPGGAAIGGLGVGAAGSSGVNLSTSGTGASSINVGGVVGQSVTLGTSVTWNLSGLGVADAANVAANRFLTRRVMNQYNQQLLTIMQEVHNSFLDMQTAEQQIDISNVNVKAAREGLRLAYRRLEIGNGTNLELIQSQQSYVNALASQIKAFVDFSNAQAQVLRDSGTITVNALLNEFRRPISLK